MESHERKGAARKSSKPRALARYWEMILMHIVGTHLYAQEITVILLDIKLSQSWRIAWNLEFQRIHNGTFTKTIEKCESIAPGEIITFKVQMGE